MAETIPYIGDSEVSQLKVPPHSIEAEQAVLGGLMLDNLAWEKIADRVDDNDFYRHDHRLIFRAIREQEAKDVPNDAVTLSQHLHSIDLLEEAGGLAYLGRLAKETPTAANIKAYADIVREKSVLRQLAAVGTEIASSAYNQEGRDSKELLEEAEKQVFKIAESGNRNQKGFLGMSSLLKSTVDQIDQLYQNEGAITGISTGFEKFDEMTSGLQAGELVIVAGRPSMGKTTFAMNLVENAAIGSGKTVGVFSLEMPGESLSMRMISSLGRIDQHNLRSGQIKDDDWARITSTVSMLSQAKIFVDDTGGLSPTELRARARRLKREHGLDLIVIDYLQLMQGSAKSASENRTAEVSEISRSLKGLAKELEIPVIALSQLNRSLEQRTDKRPVMSDLRESGAIEQDADLIVFIYRDEVYNEDSEQKGTAEIIIAKQRNGPIGKVRLTFLGKYTRFENHMPEVYGGGDDY
ncbi:MAG: replicative DNA helicase [Gammaproteobacteria bacterium]|nr:replicative DNA helicase [Gammaproteobacteria bacterium]